MTRHSLILLESLERDARRVFTIEDAMARLRLPRKSVREIISRLRKHKQVVTLTKGLYARLHPSERPYGIRMLPVINALMKYRKSKYYVGLLSAADHWGAAHHKPQVLQVVTPKQLVLRKAKDLNVELHVRKYFPEEGISSIQIASGLVSISAPELTALDLLAYQESCGGFDHVCMVIRALMGQMDGGKLIDCSKHYPIPAIPQRLGYVLGCSQAPRKLITPLKSWIQKVSPSPAQLLPSLPRKGPLHPVWNVYANTELEGEG